MSSHLDFLRKLQRLLYEGDFSATYKHALIQSLADLSVEHQPDHDGSLRLPVVDIAEKFIEYYWRQSLPFKERSGILRQNNGPQAAIVNRVAEARGDYEGSLAALQRNEQDWDRLRRKVATVVREMPLWKLQIVAGRHHEFIYKRSEFEDGVIRVLPDAVRAFRDLYEIITSYVQSEWVNRIQTIKHNRKVLGDTASLHEFLFGSGRGSVQKYKRILKEYQDSRCFYCGRAARNGDLDHFIPWSRYPIDLGHNFVYAHSKCNNAKSQFLAGMNHLAKWKDRNLGEYDELTRAFNNAGLPQDKDRSRQVAIWAYEQGEASGSHAWIEDDSFLVLGSEWREVLGDRQ